MLAFDTETALILPGRPAPPIVCGSWQAEGLDPGLETAPAIFERAHAFLILPGLIVLANAPYDLACLASEREALLRPIFDKLRAGGVHDVLTAEALNAIYHGHLGMDPRTGGKLVKPSSGVETRRYSLDVVSDLVLGRVDAKARADWRLSYALLHGIPIEHWPPDAVDYPKDDVRNPLDIAVAQRGGHAWGVVPPIPGVEAARPIEACLRCGVPRGDGFGPVSCPNGKVHDNLSALAFQVEAATHLHLGSCWSLRTDPEKIAALTADVEEKHAQAVRRFQGKGWVRNDGSDDQAAIKKAVATAYGATGTCPRCAGSGKIQPRKTKPCRGQKARGRYPGCPGDSCAVCSGSREIGYLGDPVICKAADQEYRCPACSEPQYAHPGGGATCPRGHRAATLVSGCDGTGLDLRTVGDTLPRAEKGGISASRDTLLESGDDDLAAFGENEFDKIRTTQLPWLRTGINRPLAYGVNPVLATGRISLEGSPAHQMTREGGERECIRARGAWCGWEEEWTLGSSDYGAGELCALGQFTYWKFGYSEMLRFINQTGDPGVLHAVLGAEVLGITLEEFLHRMRTEKNLKLIRQAMKPLSFGKPAAMGAAKIVLNARSKQSGFTVCEAGPAVNRKGEPGYWGIRFCVTVGGAKSCGDVKITTWKKNPIKPSCKACIEIVENDLTPAYFKRFPEIRDYHKWGSVAVEHHDRAPVVVFDADAGRPRIVLERGGCELSAFLNTPFQGMIAYLTKKSYVTASRQCYLGVDDSGNASPLGGCRLPLFMHDELVSEMPLRIADPAARKITSIMESTGALYAPDCKAWKADTALAYWLSKGMEPVEKDGKLIPWDQAKMDAWNLAHADNRRIAA